MPYERAVAKDRAVLGEELVAQPGFQRLACVIGSSQQLRQLIVAPSIAIGIGQQIQKSVTGRCFAIHRRNADDAILVGMVCKRLATSYPSARFIGQCHFIVMFGWPGIPNQRSYGYLQRFSSSLRV